MGKIKKKKVKPDYKYNSQLVGLFINMIMWDGKKSLAQDIIYTAFDIINKKTSKPAIEIFEAALENIMPKVEVKSKRVGGATYQVPVEVDKKRGTTLALRWVREIARNKKGKSIAEKIADEIISAYNNEGESIKKKQNTHKMAEANKAFAHYRW